jgi:2-polyprenyl-3-methyl-5-hydroxy-6-metoxy-1,4-benzoquinol methylase/predicted transcriptional regulator|uniref:Methyltransferase n=1 Tax=Desulfobacca acetoxidans TaxID=60893 RepID=A0A7V6A1L7_9BACT
MTNPPADDFREIMGLIQSFRPAKILMVATDLLMFDHLEEFRTADEIAAEVKADSRAVGIILNGLAALQLVDKEGERFRNGRLVSRYLVRGKDEYRGAIVRHMHHTWWGWADLEETVRRGHADMARSERWVDRVNADEDWVREFIWGMHAIARDLAPRVAAMVDLSGVKSLLDLGGGPATYAIAFAQANPAIQATVFDLPQPITIARENIRRNGLAKRVNTMAGNFLKDDIGSGYDFIWISQILHSHTEEQCRLIIDKAVKALNPGGQMVIQDFFLNDDRVSPLEAAMFSVHMLAVTPGGRAYTHREVAAMMESAGLNPPEHKITSPQTSILIGRKK